MPSEFDAGKYAEECRGMDAEKLLTLLNWLRPYRDYRHEHECHIVQAELLRRLTGRVDREKLAEMWREAHPDIPMDSWDAVRWFADLHDAGKLPREGE